MVKRTVTVAVILAIIANTLSIQKVVGMPEVGVIVSNCRSAQAILSQVEKADVGSRINRGHDYNEILGLMFAMNARLASNKIAAPELNSITADFEKELNVFRGHYNSYDDDLSQTIDFDCIGNPEGFYSKLEEARASRVQLNNGVNSLNQKIESYYESFNNLIGALQL